MGTWKSKNRHKYLLQYHIIFVCKYRKKLLVSKQISDDTKQLSYEMCRKHHVIIRYMETDKDHIQYMIETEAMISVSKTVNLDICSVCGYQNAEPKDLSVREWECPICVTKHDRNINAAKNILVEGM